MYWVLSTGFVLQSAGLLIEFQYYHSAKQKVIILERKYYVLGTEYWICFTDSRFLDGLSIFSFRTTDNYNS